MNKYLISFLGLAVILVHVKMYTMYSNLSEENAELRQQIEDDKDNFRLIKAIEYSKGYYKAFGVIKHCENLYQAPFMKVTKKNG